MVWYYSVHLKIALRASISGKLSIASVKSFPPIPFAEAEAEAETAAEVEAAAAAAAPPATGDDRFGRDRISLSRCETCTHTPYKDSMRKV